MRGLQVGDRTFHVVNGAVLEGPCEGPRIPVSAA
jgi:hypothetical protein